MSRMKLDFDDGCPLKFNHPEVMNAVGSEMLADFREAVEEIKLNAGNVRCVCSPARVAGFALEQIYRTTLAVINPRRPEVV